MIGILEYWIERGEKPTPPFGHPSRGGDFQILGKISLYFSKHWKMGEEPTPASRPLQGGDRYTTREVPSSRGVAVGWDGVFSIPSTGGVPERRGGLSPFPSCGGVAVGWGGFLK